MLHAPEAPGLSGSDICKITIVMTENYINSILSDVAINIITTFFTIILVG